MAALARPRTAPRRAVGWGVRKPDRRLPRLVREHPTPASHSVGLEEV